MDYQASSIEELFMLLHYFYGNRTVSSKSHIMLTCNVELDVLQLENINTNRTMLRVNEITHGKFEWAFEIIHTAAYLEASTVRKSRRLWEICYIMAAVRLPNFSIDLKFWKEFHENWKVLMRRTSHFQCKVALYNKVLRFSFQNFKCDHVHPMPPIASQKGLRRPVSSSTNHMTWETNCSLKWQ